MKHLFCSILLLATPLMAVPEDYVNFVRQIQEDSGVEWDVSVAPRGTMLSTQGVGPDGSLYQLWSIHHTTACEYHLDEEFVSAYEIKAAITIETGDPYESIPRTRVDQPFTVSVNISGLLGLGRGVPDSATTLHLAREGFVYPDPKHSLEGLGGPAPQFREEFAIPDNGELVMEFPMTVLGGEDLTKVEGQEVFTLSTLVFNKVGGRAVGNGLESALVQIWPVAGGSFSGIDPARTYDEVPPITVTLEDLYPDSTTYVRVYREGSVPSEAIDINSSYVIIEDSIPRDRTLVLGDLDNLFEEEGDYTLEIIHRTPFGTEILNRFHPLRIERSIKVRGTLYTSR